MLKIKLGHNSWRVYFQYGVNGNKKEITMCHIANDETKTSFIGECTLYFKDVSDRTVGRKIALERALKEGNFNREDRTYIWEAYVAKINAPNKKMGADLMLDERNRQMDKEGFGVKHDDAHVNGEILQYAMYMLDQNNPFPSGWAVEWRHKVLNRSKQENLIKAGALIAAEYDRVERIERDRKKIKADTVA